MKDIPLNMPWEISFIDKRDGKWKPLGLISTEEKALQIKGKLKRSGIRCRVRNKEAKDEPSARI